MSGGGQGRTEGRILKLIGVEMSKVGNGVRVCLLWECRAQVQRWEVTKYEYFVAVLN